jgi:quercetin dioxygenase-like cupin family protein
MHACVQLKLLGIMLRGAAGLPEVSMSLDPTTTNPGNYKVIFENERVRVLEFQDKPGDRTSLHEHPDSVIFTLSSFRRRMYAADESHTDVELTAGRPGWLPAQRHAGHNIGDTESHAIFVELKDGATGDRSTPALGPTGPVVDR